MTKTKIHQAELTAWSRTYTGPKFHAVLSDPPYDLGFMGKKWDTAADFRAWGEALLPHLHPGAVVLMFGGTRTWHKLAVGMESAGFEMWDTLMWLYGSGMPKALDVSKLIDKKIGHTRRPIAKRRGAATNNTFAMGDALAAEYDETEPSPTSRHWAGHKTTALKPAWEPILAFKKPLTGGYAEALLDHGAGALNIDGSRIGDELITDSGSPKNGNPVIWGDRFSWATQQRGGRPRVGRYPANVILDDTAAEALDKQTGILTSGANPTRRNSDKTRTAYGKFNGRECRPARGADAGGASRFFYCAKASTRERNAGLDQMPTRTFGRSNGTRAAIARGETRDMVPGFNGTRSTRNHHPTVKPIALAQHLATLLLPPASIGTRRILVPFSGSGSEMIGCALAGWDEVHGVEREAEYTPIAAARIDHWQAVAAQ